LTIDGIAEIRGGKERGEGKKRRERGQGRGGPPIHIAGYATVVPNIEFAISP